MLIRRMMTGALVLAVCAMAGGARAQDEEKDGVRRPERLTVGVADQFLGQLAPNKKTLYFVSNRHTTNEIYWQNVDEGRAKPLFDEGADVTWPRVSPDGKSLLYISYSERATGQLCVRDLPSGEGRRCLDGSSSPLLAEWIDSKRIVLVTRVSIEGDLRALEVSAGSKLGARPLLDRNLTSPAVSPDGRWLVYVPLERGSTRVVGPAFQARAAQRLEAIRLDAPSEATILSVDVPGLTGQPVFARDGRSLYFVQFFTDSNHDGVVDAGDHGVLFRVPLSFGPDGRGAPVAGAPMQLTDESWNCQYPAPTAERLITTCSRGRNLDLYSLPLDGQVPSHWAKERLGLEIELASSHARLQILYHHRLALATNLDGRRFLMLRLVRLHLELEEFDAAEFYAKHVATLEDPESAALAQALFVLIEHQKAVRDHERGRMVRDFVAEARKRMAKLPVPPEDSRAAAVLTRLVRSEIADTIGDKTLARSELEAAPLNDKTPRSVLEAYYERADALYRELDDREALIAACRRLGSRKGLPVDDQLRYARAAVRAMVRGLPIAEADARLAREREASPGDSELGFAIDLGRIVLAIRHEKNAPVRKQLLEFYEQHPGIERRRVIVLDAVQRAIQLDADPIIEAMAQEYIDDVKPGTQEARRAERLYTQVMIGRAFRRRAAQRLDEARADFEAVAKRTNSFEAVVGAIDLRMRAGDKPAAIEAEYRGRKGEGAAALSHFVTAYLLARQLPKLEGDEHGKAAQQAIDALKGAWVELKNQCIARDLFGAVRHEEYLRTGDRAAAESAGTHYLVALELAGNNLRYRALVLGQLGILHTQVGNYRMALGYLKDRDKLPYAENSEGFAVRSAKARALLHIGREKDAAAAAEEALASLDHAPPRLLPYRMLALDRAALYNLAAGHFDRALVLYDAELPLIDADRGPAAAHNRFVVRLAHAAAALGAKKPERALGDLGQVDRLLDDKKFASTLAWPHAENEQVVLSYRMIAAGLRAQASEGLGQLAAAARALETRRTLLQKEYERTDRVEDLQSLMLAEAQLADNAAQRRDPAATAKSIGKALEHAGTLRELAKGVPSPDQLDVLWLAAELSAFTPTTKTPDVSNRLNQDMSEMVKQGLPAFRNYVRWFEIYLSLMGPIAKDKPAAKPAAASASASAPAPH